MPGSLGRGPVREPLDEPLVVSTRALPVAAWSSRDGEGRQAWTEVESAMPQPRRPREALLHPSPASPGRGPAAHDQKAASHETSARVA